MTHQGFGDRLAQERREKAARERRDVMQRDVATAVGTTPATVSRWEQGLAKPGDHMMEKLAAYFGVTPGWLRYGQEPREAPKASRPAPKVEADVPVPRSTKRKTGSGS